MNWVYSKMQLAIYVFLIIYGVGLRSLYKTPPPFIFGGNMPSGKKIIEHVRIEKSLSKNLQKLTFKTDSKIRVL